MEKIRKDESRKGTAVIKGGEKGVGLNDLQEALKATIDTVATDLSR